MARSRSPARGGHNFTAAAGPLPAIVAAEVAAACRDWRGQGSVLGLSFVSEAFRELQAETEGRLRRLLAIPDDYRVLFMAGGASAQFSLLPLNLLAGRGAIYVDSGHWSRRAAAEAGRYGPVSVVGEDGQWPADVAAAYCHLTSNETADGRQCGEFPELPVPLAADMTSDFLTRPIDFRRLAVVYAGLQKTIGVAGLTAVIVRADLLGRAHPATPRVMDYAAQAAAGCRLNTPPVFAIFVAHAMLGWIERQGGVAAMAQAAARRSREIYQVIDASAGFYRCRIGPAQRSPINICFGLADEGLTESFLAAAEGRGYSGLRGHPEVGGLRVSLYNGTPEPAVAGLAAWMRDFAREFACDLASHSGRAP